MAHLGIVGGKDLAPAPSSTHSRDIVACDLKLLADDLAQDARRLSDPRRRHQRLVRLDRSQRALGIACHLGEQPHASIPVLPITRRLHPRPRVVEAKPAPKPLGSLRVRKLDRIEQLANRTANERRRVLHRRGAEHRRRVEDLLDLPADQAKLARELERALEHDPLLAIQEQARPELDQTRRVEALVVERQTERDLPAQIEAHRLHRLPVRKTAAVGEEQDLGERTGRNRGPPTALRVAVGEVAVTDDPLTVLGEQTVKGIARHHVAAPTRVEQPPLGRIGYRQHPPPPSRRPINNARTSTGRQPPRLFQRSLLELRQRSRPA